MQSASLKQEAPRLDLGVVHVEDTGPGIPEQDRGTIFEAGYTTTDDGSGFGLTIAKRIAEAHGWKIRATVSKAGGARFEITGLEPVT